MKQWIAGALVAAHTVVASPVALADDAEEAEESSEAPAEPTSDRSSRLRFRTRSRLSQRAVSLTLSGALVADLVIEGTGEINLPEQHSAAVVFGMGSTLEVGIATTRLMYVQTGAQYRYTFLGDFDLGLYTGFELLAKVQPFGTGTPWDMPLTPLVGLKYAAPFGLTVDVNAGPSLVLSNIRPARAGAQLNVGVGWTFGKKPW